MSMTVIQSRALPFNGLEVRRLYYSVPISFPYRKYGQNCTWFTEWRIELVFSHVF